MASLRFVPSTHTANPADLPALNLYGRALIVGPSNGYDEDERASIVHAARVLKLPRFAPQA